MNNDLKFFYRHELQQHQKASDGPPKDSNEDFFIYHSAKFAFGFILFEFSDAIKEGDGHRLFNLYKLALLIYKCNGHFKYAYIVVLYLVKCIAILSKFQAFRLKWNRFFNRSGGKGKNILLDLEKELQNKDLQVTWVALGPNIDENNAECTAGCL